MKKLILIATLSASTSFANITTLEVINKGLTEHHNGDEVMEVLRGRRNFVGLFRPLLHGIGGYNGPGATGNQTTVYDLDTSFKKHSHLSERQVQKAIKKLKKKCQKYLKTIQKQATRILNERYYCSDVFVYTGDTNNPTQEGIVHTAKGQLDERFVDAYVSRGTKSESQTRLSLPSNNENLGDYEVYTIAIMRNWDQ